MKIFSFILLFLGIMKEDLFSNKINIDFNNKRKLIHLKKVLSVIQKIVCYNISLRRSTVSIDMNTIIFVNYLKIN